MPGPRPTRSTPPAADDPPPADPGDGDPPAADDPAPVRDCGGIHVGVPLDPLLNVDLCLLD